VSPRKSAVLAAIVVALAVAALPAGAQRAEPLPEDLEQVGVTENFDAQVPGELSFVDDEGRAVRLADYFQGDKPLLLSLVYYECPMLCTLVLDGMVRVLEEMEWVPGDEFEVVTVSIDPGEAVELAAEKKKNYLRSYGRPEAAAGWHFLTGEKSQIERLAQTVGFGYRYLEEQDEYAHPAVLIVLTPEGKVSRYLTGVQHDPKTLRLSLVEASQGKIGNTVDKFILYCYRYDAEEGRYAPVAMQVMRVGGALTIVVFGAALLAFWLRESRHRRQKRLA
jgi:protein SCO1/2